MSVIRKPIMEKRERVVVDEVRVGTSYTITLSEQEAAALWYMAGASYGYYLDSIYHALKPEFEGRVDNHVEAGVPGIKLPNSVIATLNTMSTRKKEQA